MTTFGDQLFQFGGAAVSGPLSTGPVQYVKGSTGSDGHSGKRPDRSVKTWGQAQTNIAADKNGVIYFVAESNSAGSTNIVLPAASTFTFSKNGVKVQGINQNGIIGHRSRVTIAADATNVTPMITWSASNSSCANVHFIYAEADADDKGCFNVTGERNYFYRCHFAGIGSDTQDVADAYSLKIDGDENLFEQCVIGLDTIKRGTGDNSELVMATQATRNVFKDCIFLTYAEATGHQFAKIPANSIDRFLLFDNCKFINSGLHGGTAVEMDEALEVGEAPGGTIILHNCALYGAKEWDSNDKVGVLQVGMLGSMDTTDAGTDTIGIGDIPTLA